MITYCSTDHITTPSGIFSNLIAGNQIWELHLHDGFFEIMVILNGSLSHNAEGSTRQMVAGDMVFMPPGTTHSLYCASQDLMFLNLATLPLTIAQAMGYLNLSNIPQKISFFRIPGEIVDFLTWNYSFFKNSDDATLRIGADRNALALLLPHCCNAEDTSDWFDVLLTQMKKRENFQLGVSRMQQLAFCSPAHLSRTCRERIGVTPTQFIERTRIEYAVQLLRYTNYSIRDVGVECGFGNLGHFYRCFERHAGMTPGQCRNQALDSLKPSGAAAGDGAEESPG